MALARKQRTSPEIKTWEESSGLLDFLASIGGHVEKFNRSFEFGIDNMELPPDNIDGDARRVRYTGFVLRRSNPLVPELQYCLYTILEGRILKGYIGQYRNGSIRTIRELKPLKQFKKAEAVVHGWLCQLVRASCEKITF